jgi:hypothetical protein
MDEYTSGELWARWIVMHICGALLGLFVGVLVGFPFLFLCGYAGVLVAPLMGGVGLALTAAWAQQLTLWPYSPLTWARNTMLGFLVAFPVSLFAGGATVLSPLDWVRAGALGGLILALAQLPILYPISRAAWIWVPANMAGWAVGGGLAHMVNRLLTNAEQTQYVSGRFFPEFFWMIINPLVAGGVALVGAALITGGALRSMQQPAPPPPTRQHGDTVPLP